VEDLGNREVERAWVAEKFSVSFPSGHNSVLRPALCTCTGVPAHEPWQNQAPLLTFPLGEAAQ
jgi:hypothetical protein